MARQQVWSGDEWCDRQAGCESVYGAWKRLFGEEFDKTKAVRSEDSHDEITYFMPNGHSVTFACDGNYIYKE